MLRVANLILLLILVGLLFASCANAESSENKIMMYFRDSTVPFRSVYETTIDGMDCLYMEGQSNSGLTCDWSMRREDNSN